MTDRQPKHVFISYVRENQKQVDRLCQDLESHGVNVWLDRNNITPGIFWKDAIPKAIQEGAFFIACFSKEYNEKTITHMSEELNLSLEVLRKRPREQAWFIPLVLSGDVPDWEIFPGKTLQDIQWVPLYEDWDAAIQKILSVIKPIPVEIQNLIYALRSEDKAARDRAAQALVEIGDLSAVPSLTKTLKDEDKNVRQLAAKALRQFGPKAKAAVPDLIKALKDEDKNIRQLAAEILGTIGPKAKEAVPTLLNVLKDDNDYMHYSSAADTLLKIGSEATPVLIEALKDKNERVRWCAAVALRLISPKTKTTVPDLIEALKDKNEHVRWCAAVVLRNIGSEAKAGVRTLIETFKDENEDVRLAAVQALGEIRPAAKDAIPTLIKALKDKSKEVVKAAVWVLGEIGPEAKARCANLNWGSMHKSSKCFTSTDQDANRTMDSFNRASICSISFL